MTTATPPGAFSAPSGILARVACALASLLLAGCAAHNPMARWVSSPNYDERGPILIVLHATEQDSVQESLDTLRTRNSGGPVSAHYLIGRDGTLYQLVDDARRAWHAGPGRWGTITDVNSASIGIELDNNGSDAFPSVQVDALLRLLADVCARHAIPRAQVIGHADMAPTRKRDPGRLFPWARLAAEGYGRWPDAGAGDPPPRFDPMTALGALGYPLEDPAAAIHAFHVHFRGMDLATGGVPETLDPEDARILHALTASGAR